ncbi:MAG: hypothetical protein JWN25_2229 [Verrucomicrobiales bacterium]|nr:hypothetical protein [Verrucomicrobiales bacterium]MDB6130114.1 hypothetical protein [Verrucomicrobiales bacterium]
MNEKDQDPKRERRHARKLDFCVSEFKKLVMSYSRYAQSTRPNFGYYTETSPERNELAGEQTFIPE